MRPGCSPVLPHGSSPSRLLTSLIHGPTLSVRRSPAPNLLLGAHAAGPERQRGFASGSGLASGEFRCQVVLRRGWRSRERESRGGWPVRNN